MMMITMVIVHEGMTTLVMMTTMMTLVIHKDWMGDIDFDATLVVENSSLFNLFQLPTDTSLGSESTWLAWTEPPTPLPTFHGELIHHVNIIYQYEFNIPPQNIVTQVHIWAQSLSIVGLSDKSSHRKNFEASLFLFEVMMMDICCWWWGWWPWWIWRNKVSLSSLLFNVGGLIIELLDQWNS